MKRLYAHSNRAAEVTSMMTDGDTKAMQMAVRFAEQNYRYVSGGDNDKGQLVWFCWSTKKDKEGWWWGWREVHTKTTIKRYQLSSRKTKAAVKALAYRRQWAYIDKRSGDDDEAEIEQVASELDASS